MKKKDEEEVHMSTSPKDQPGMYKKGKKYIPIEKLSNVYLQRAKMAIQRKELFYFNLAQFFADKADEFDKEAARRGIELKDYDAQYFKNRVTLRKAIEE